MLILIAEDDAGVRNSLQLLLSAKHELVLCENGAQAVEALEKKAFDVVVTDHQMPKLCGLDLIKKGKQISPDTSFLLMTAFGSVEQAVEAIKNGAVDYITKPFDLSEFEHRIARIEELRSWKHTTELRQERNEGVDRLKGSSVAIKKAREFAQKVSDVGSPVLILGPSGVGKEVMARAIHETGSRALKPFIAINCASLTEQLMESELFGHEKGAFTGATTTKQGKFDLASGGTLFLDELGEFSTSLQAKLLRVLQEKEYSRLGGVRLLKTDARVIAATNRPLREMIVQGTFREDLFFRLNVLTIDIPRLVDRKDDIPVFIDLFWQRFSKEFGKKLSLSAEAKNALMIYAYPGNIRELQNVIERIFVLVPNNATVLPDALPAEFHGAKTIAVSGNEVSQAVSLDALGEGGLAGYLDAIEEKLIRRAMEAAGDNQVKAVELLKTSRGSLQYKLKKYGLLANESSDGNEEAA